MHKYSQAVLSKNGLISSGNLMEQNNSTDLVFIPSGKQSRFTGNIPLLRPSR